MLQNDSHLNCLCVMARLIEALTIYDISKCILDLDPDLCQNILCVVTLSILHIETCMIPLSKAVLKGFISSSYT